MCGWSTNVDSDNYMVRHDMFLHANLDIIGIAESHLRGNDVLKIPAYEWSIQGTVETSEVPETETVR